MFVLEEDVPVTISLGPFLAPADGDTAVTGLTTAHDYVYLSKNGGALTLKTETTALDHDLLGFYHCLLDATDVGTKGTLKVVVHVATGMIVWEDFQIVTHDFYQSMCGDHVIGAAALAAYDPPTNTEFEARSLPSADYVVVGDTIAGVTTVTTCTTNTDMLTPAAILDHNVTEHTTASTVGAYVNDVYKGVVTDATGTNVAADVVALKAETVLIVEDTGTTIPATLAALSTTADITAGILDHDVTAHTTASTVGKYVNDMYAGVVTNATGTDVGSDTAEILTRLPDATAGAANGLVICGTNAAITVTSATADALTLTASGANKSGLVINGNGSAAAVDINAGLTGAGIDIAGGGTSGNGITLTATDGDGIEVTGAGSGHVDIDASITDLTTLITTVGTAGVGLTNLGDARVGTTNTAVVTDIPATLAALATTADVAAGVLDHDVTAHTTASTVGAYVNDVYKGVVTDAAGTNVSIDVVALKAVADTIATDTTTDIPGTITTLQNMVTDIHGTDLPAVKTDTGNILTDTAFIEKWILDKLTRTDNGDGTISYVLYDTNNSTPLATWVFTTATGTRAKAT